MFITAKIVFVLISWSAVHLHDFHMFTAVIKEATLKHWRYNSELLLSIPTRILNRRGTLNTASNDSVTDIVFFVVKNDPLSL